ncbi:hypothetical protein GCM10007935_39720 [Hydrogenophaga electricum]|uniref:Uncharacterized protein n=1 Tax=Hydrogenophaga electricum TaxID=1230953 RepID=A0ABQ6C8G4_9BURK|nr:hypothetical protein GCM10007935_39720 [Hydrogenophaga electricum]
MCTLLVERIVKKSGARPMVAREALAGQVRLPTGLHAVARIDHRPAKVFFRPPSTVRRMSEAGPYVRPLR